MEGFLSFLIFAVFFYLMMRFGCGAHMMHGHHKSKEKQNSQPVYDPVCGMKIEDDEGYGKLHEGQLFRFCSRKCLDEFDERPGKYIANTDKITELKQEEHHEA